MGFSMRFDKLSVCARKAMEKTGLVFFREQRFLGVAHVDKVWYSDDY